MYVYYCRTYEKAVSGGGEREKGGHVLRDTTSRGLYVRVWPPHTSERRGGGGGCEQEGWQGGEGRARMSGQEERLTNSTSVDVEVDLHRRRLGRSQTNFALQAIENAESEKNRSVVALARRWR